MNISTHKCLRAEWEVEKAGKGSEGYGAKLYK